MNEIDVLYPMVKAMLNWLNNKISMLKNSIAKEFQSTTLDKCMLCSNDTSEIIKVLLANGNYYIEECQSNIYQSIFFANFNISKEIYGSIKNLSRI